MVQSNISNEGFLVRGSISDLVKIEKDRTVDHPLTGDGEIPEPSFAAAKNSDEYEAEARKRILLTNYRQKNYQLFDQQFKSRLIDRVHRRLNLRDNGSTETSNSDEKFRPQFAAIEWATKLHEQPKSPLRSTTFTTYLQVTIWFLKRYLAEADSSSRFFASTTRA